MYIKGEFPFTNFIDFLKNFKFQISKNLFKMEIDHADFKGV
jgi:hypothetical protein